MSVTRPSHPSVPRRESALSKDRALAGLRQRCLRRARQQRSELIRQSRDMGSPASVESPLTPDALNGIIASELRTAAAHNGLAALADAGGSTDYLELMAALEQEVLRDLANDVSSLMEEEYLAHESSEEAHIQHLLADALPHDDDKVLCPICYSHHLMLSVDGRIECEGDGCPLRLDARGHAAPLELLRERMCTLLQQHSETCDGMPTCRMPESHERSLGTLLLSCVKCQCNIGVV